MKLRLDDAKSVAWFLARPYDVLRLLAIMFETRVLSEAFNGASLVAFKLAVSCIRCGLCPPRQCSHPASQLNSSLLTRNNQCSYP